MNPFTKKNHRGQSHKHVDGPRAGHGGGDHENRRTAKRTNRGGPNKGPETSDKQAPHKQKVSKELKHVDQGDIINEWCRGKRGSYK